jgi:hypothetical protein
LIHQQQFQAIAMNLSNGTRAAGTIGTRNFEQNIIFKLHFFILFLFSFKGYNASAEYVESFLNSTGFYNVTRNYFTIPAFDILTTPTLQETYPSNRFFIYQQDFVLIQFTQGRKTHS